MKHRIGPWFEQVLNVAVIGGAFATIPLTLLLEAGTHRTWAQTADWAIWSVFFIELLFHSL